MYKTILLTSLLSLSTLVTSHAISLPTRSDSPKLDVQIEQVEGSNIKVKVTNQGPGAVRLLAANSLLEKLHNEKLVVKKDGAQLDFHGVDFHLDYNKFKPEHFVSVKVGETIENTVNIAQTHDLSAGGSFEIVADNRIEYAKGDDTKLYGSIPYESNKLTLQLARGAVSAPETEAKKLEARSRFGKNSCSTGQMLNLTRAATIGSRWAAMGAIEATKPRSAVWNKYFRYNDTSNMEIYLKFHQIVAQRLALISADLAGGFVSEVHCKNDFAIPEAEVNDACAAYPNSAIAFTYRSTCQIALCKKFWDLPIQTDDCTSRQSFDIASTLIHELSHCTTLGKSDDFMTAGMSIQNAQTHALFAKACAVGGPRC